MTETPISKRARRASWAFVLSIMVLTLGVAYGIFRVEELTPRVTKIERHHVTVHEACRIVERAGYACLREGGGSSNTGNNPPSQPGPPPGGPPSEQPGLLDPATDLVPGVECDVNALGIQVC